MKVVLAVLLYCSVLITCKTRSAEQSQVLQESEDRETDYTRSLVNVDLEFENYINNTIQKCRTSFALLGSTKKIDLNTRVEKILHCTFEKLGRQVKETGWGPMKVAPLCKIEIWFMENLSDKKNQIVRVPWEHTRYGRNKTGITQIGRVPIFGHLSKSGADHTIVATIRLKGTLTGIDKWAHFFTTGYHLWRQKEIRANTKIRTMVSRWLEGDDLTDEEIKKYRHYVEPMTDYHILGRSKYGVLGRWSTGIISQADIYANEAGFQFYNQLATNPDTFRFNLDQLEIKKMNEVFNPSKFVPGLKVDN